MPDPVKQFLGIFGTIMGLVLFVIIMFDVVIPIMNNAFAPKI